MGKKSIYVVCKKCGKRIQIKLNPNLNFSDDNLYLIVHAHGELGEDAHALSIEIDRNYNVRSSRVSNEFFFTFNI
ncbi:MAG: hypothetical protein ACTSWY_10965 [Promethearchaeota archaeon]